MSISFLIDLKGSKDNQKGNGYLVLLGKSKPVVSYFRICILMFKGT